jgi:hypothetical protein
MLCSLFLFAGTLSTLAHFLKAGRRSLTLPLTAHLWGHIATLMASDAVTGNSVARKACMKLAQRTALTLLDPTAISVTAATTRVARSLSAAPPAATADDEVLALTPEGAKIVPAVIDALLGGLRDSDTVVRWSAAKGVGRVAMRLPAVCAKDITDALLELFSPAEMDTGWQGACLALAELVRHGLLPTHRLPEVLVLNFFNVLNFLIVLNFLFGFRTMYDRDQQRLRAHPRRAFRLQLLTGIDTGWQGACLALAELVRKGVLQTHRLPQVCYIDYYKHTSAGIGDNDVGRFAMQPPADCANDIMIALLDMCGAVKRVLSVTYSCHAGGPIGWQSAALRGAPGTAQCGRPRPGCSGVCLLGSCSCLQAKGDGG